MYEFIDVTEVSSGARLPSEALKINGEYIENLVPGYRTLYVSGRESLAPELNTYETGRRDGSRLGGRRYPARTIVVGYRLVASSASAFRSAYNKLGSVLNTEDAELIFADELDKFYIGTPSGMGEVEPGKNAVTSEIEITCMDPFKYSVAEYEVQPTLDSRTTFAVNYRGSYKAFPTLEVDFAKEAEAADGALTGSGDCGYVVFMNDSNKVIQIGDPDETDGESYQASQTLVNQIFNVYDTTVTSKWKANTGAISSSEHIQAGSMKLNSNIYGKALIVNSYGSGSKWHGPSITRTIPGDAAGQVGAKNFRFTWEQRISPPLKELSGSKQKGVFQAMLINRNGSKRKIVAGMAIWKNTVGNKATLRLYLNGRAVEDITIDIAAGFKLKLNTVAENPPFPCTIQKKGSEVSFNIRGINKVFKSASVADLDVHEITFYFGQYGGSKALSINELYWAKFIKDSCETYKDIPNKFSANDVVLADCRDSEIYLNGLLTPELGAVGNDWEEFYLKPGMNQIGVAWSDWVAGSSAPTFKMHYREVFL